MQKSIVPVMIFGIKGPPSSARPSAGMYRRHISMMTLHTAPMQKMMTLNPREPELTSNGSPFTHAHTHVLLLQVRSSVSQSIV